MMHRADVALAILIATCTQLLADAKSEALAEQYVVKCGGRVVRDVSNALQGEPVFAVAFDTKDVKDVDLKPLAAFPKLYRLTFSGSTSTDRALAKLADLPSITSVSLDDSDVTDAGLASLNSLAKLRNLDLTRCSKLTASGLKAIGKCRGLEVVNASETAVDGGTLLGWAEMVALRELKLCKCKHTLGEAAVAFKGWTTLQEFDATGTLLGDASLVSLGQCKNLLALNLTGTGVTDRGLRSLNRLGKLQRLNLSENKITGAGFEELDALGQLETLYLNDTAVNDGGMLFIARNRGVKMLDLDRTKLTDVGLKELATARALEYLSIEETNTGDEALLQLVERAKKLQKVHARKSKITAAGANEARKKASELTISLD